MIAVDLHLNAWLVDIGGILISVVYKKDFIVDVSWSFAICSTSFIDTSMLLLTYQSGYKKSFKIN